MQSSTFTLTDAPQAPPEVVRLNLRSQSLWERIQEKARLLAYFHNEQEKVMRSAEKRGYYTDEELRFLNNLLSSKLDETMDRFKRDVSSMFAITKEDSLEIVALKVEVGSKLLEWLNNLVEWLLAKLTAIFEKAKEALEWCWTQVKELFGVLYAVLKK
ncbi:uncharacterized protein ACA1_174370 [Acanthamoeba castellanii str. Neff]|uniref:Uncharacterized protein n=1 Tax=Acanthamoeba castellanii (strain ATCC 30010 / Neff) TaxID=1257118 RepID=L8HK51_ACACF|nr:uncharacterized protein ACA1_174370 [Acanthamoeba castellanii str. Neff]ELR24776.1 hypothetical protein ACA1_174370 [Acanthamoeba castellanii str. Neff]